MAVVALKQWQWERLHAVLLLHDKVSDTTSVMIKLIFWWTNTFSNKPPWASYFKTIPFSLFWSIFGLCENSNTAGFLVTTSHGFPLCQNNHHKWSLLPLLQGTANTVASDLCSNWVLMLFPTSTWLKINSQWSGLNFFYQGHACHKNFQQQTMPAHMATTWEWWLHCLTITAMTTKPATTMSKSQLELLQSWHDLLALLLLWCRKLPAMVTGNGYRQWIADNVTPMMNDTPTNAWQLAGWCTLCSCW